jgi:hypothetical protein
MFEKTDQDRTTLLLDPGKRTRYLHRFRVKRKILYLGLAILFTGIAICFFLGDSIRDMLFAPLLLVIAAIQIENKISLATIVDVLEKQKSVEPNGPGYRREAPPQPNQ